MLPKPIQPQKDKNRRKFMSEKYNPCNEGFNPPKSMQPNIEKRGFNPPKSTQPAPTSKPNNTQPKKK